MISLLQPKSEVNKYPLERLETATALPTAHRGSSVLISQEQGSGSHLTQAGWDRGIDPLYGSKESQ